MAAGQLLVAALVLVAASAIIDAPWTLSPPPLALGAVAMVAVFSTAIPMVLLFWLVREAGPTSASLMTLFMPVVAVTVGTVVLGEQLPWQAFVGLGLILLGAASVDGRLRRLGSQSAERV
jgi:drug/metabolite transporter (DMT)-like permease